MGKNLTNAVRDYVELDRKVIDYRKDDLSPFTRRLSHSAKGQEWQAVYLLNVVDGCISSDMASGLAEELEEERAPALCRDDARQGRVALAHPAAVLRASAG